MDVVISLVALFGWGLVFAVAIMYVVRRARGGELVDPGARGR